MKKTRWDTGVEYSVAMEEVSFRKGGLVSELDEQLSSRFPPRTREAFRGHRKSAKYSEQLDRLLPEPSRGIDQRVEHIVAEIVLVGSGSGSV